MFPHKLLNMYGMFEQLLKEIVALVTQNLINNKEIERHNHKTIN